MVEWCVCVWWEDAKILEHIEPMDILHRYSHAMMSNEGADTRAPMRTPSTWSRSWLNCYEHLCLSFHLCAWISFVLYMLNCYIMLLLIGKSQKAATVSHRHEIASVMQTTTTIYIETSHLIENSVDWFCCCCGVVSLDTKKGGNRTKWTWKKCAAI